MKGKTVLITGANTGIGFWSARDLAKAGATVVMTSRDEAKGAAAVDKVRQETGSPSVELLLLDLADLASVRAAAASFLARHPRLDVLLNNAGLISPKRETTKDGHERTFQTNHLGHFLLTNLLLDRLKASAPSRIINVSSRAHQRGAMDWDDLEAERSYSSWAVYSQSKLMNVLFTYELARRLEGTGVTANCLHPGVIASDFLRNLPWFLSGPAKLVLTPADKGAEPQVRLATDPVLEKTTGRYFDELKEARSNPESYDREAQARLWRLSERLTGLVPA